MREGVNSTMLGLASETMDAMMRATTRRALTSADVIINVPLQDYGSLDWRRAPSLIEEGYKAAEAMRDQLLPLALTRGGIRCVAHGAPGTAAYDPADADVHRSSRASAAVTPGGWRCFSPDIVGAPVDPRAIEQDIATTSGLDRYESVTWLSDA